MSLVAPVEITPLSAVQGGMSQFYTPQSSHETMLVRIPATTLEDLFVHHFQTDQLLVVRGSFVLVILQNRRYQYIPLSEQQPTVVKIPRGVPHGAINLSEAPCFLVNAVLRHGAPSEKDYRPIKPPLPYDKVAIQAALQSLECPVGI